MSQSGLKATPRTEFWWPRRGRPSSVCVRTSHSRTVPPSPAKASVSPSGLNATTKTRPWRPRSGCPSWLCVGTCHSRTSAASPAECKCRLGLKATPLTEPWWPRRGRPSWVCVRTSHSRTVPLDAGGGERAPVRAEGDAFYGFDDTRSGGWRCCAYIPQQYRPVLAGGGKSAPVRAEGDAEDAALAAAQRSAALRAFAHPTAAPSCRRPRTRACARSLKARPSTGPGGAQRPAELPVVRLHIPQPHDPAVACGRKRVPVRAEGDAAFHGTLVAATQGSGDGLRTSHSHTVPSSPAEASVRPSRLKDAKDGALATAERLAASVRLHIPQPHRPGRRLRRRACAHSGRRRRRRRSPDGPAGVG